MVKKELDELIKRESGKIESGRLIHFTALGPQGSADIL
jgi:hypothetical protein